MTDFQTLGAKWYDYLLRCAHRFRANHWDAEDLVQESLLQAYRKFHLFDRSKGKFHTWVYAVMWKVQIDMRKTERRLKRPQFEAAVPPDRAAPLQDLGNRADCQQLIDGLTPVVREAVKLKYLDGLGYRDIAKKLGVPFSTAVMRVWYGICKLRESA